MLADEGAFIGGVALTMTAITLLVSAHAGSSAWQQACRASLSGAWGDAAVVAAAAAGGIIGCCLGVLVKGVLVNCWVSNCQPNHVR